MDKNNSQKKTCSYSQSWKECIIRQEKCPCIEVWNKVEGTWVGLTHNPLIQGTLKELQSIFCHTLQYRVGRVQVRSVAFRWTGYFKQDYQSPPILEEDISVSISLVLTLIPSSASISRAGEPQSGQTSFTSPLLTFGKPHRLCPAQIHLLFIY